MPRSMTPITIERKIAAAAGKWIGSGLNVL